MIGEACGCDRDCQSSFCVDGVCCNTRLHRDVHGLQRPGIAGDLQRSCRRAARRGTPSRLPASRRRPAAVSTAPATAAAPAASTSRERCARRGRVRTRRWSASTSATGVGHCKAGAGDDLRAVQLRSGHARLRGHVPVQRRLRQRRPLRERKLRAQAAWRGVHARTATAPRASAPTASAATSAAAARASAATRRAGSGRAGRSIPAATIRTTSAATRGRPRAARRAPATASAAARSTRAETICVAPSCSGDRLNTAGTCNGIGTCRPPGVQACAPYRCSDGACIARCTGDADCVTGQVCQSGSCGPKPNGQPCAAAAECISNFCVDGVCCDEACGGACRSCALPSSMGKCAPVADGAADPRNICIDKGARQLRHRRQVRRRRRDAASTRRGRPARPRAARTASTRRPRRAARRATA